ncbi:MAG: N-acetyl-gamma-glutamyl-phosphate reductase, partial [Gemmatimonadetes bacterium]|nr:N-acetyl-gamma-glutamyl-phosphate reductase [Gemmatimonadota bacterium]
MVEERRATVAVVGGSGYTGLELLDRLARHGEVEVAWASSRSEAGRPTPVPGVRFTERTEADLEGLDLVFLCLPHGAAVPWAAAAGAAGVRVIDLTADHRPGSGREAGVVYGMAEHAADSVADASMVANPGCYPTGVILALAPLLEAQMIDTARAITVSAASGVTGAGRSPKRELLFAEVHGDFRAYGLGNGHRHLLEMRARLPGAGLLFVPHLLPVPRGILETIAVPVGADVRAEAVTDVWREAYRDSPAVSIAVDEAPTLSDVTGTDRLILYATDNPGLAPPTLT